jgi:hypothetical protein
VKFILDRLAITKVSLKLLRFPSVTITAPVLPTNATFHFIRYYIIIANDVSKQNTPPSVA